MLKKGMTVFIYSDPITKKHIEGKAKLISQYRADEGDGLSMWVVEFEDELGSEYVRTIFTEKEETSNA